MPVYFGDMLTGAFHGTCSLTERERVEGGMFALGVYFPCAVQSVHSTPQLGWMDGHKCQFLLPQRWLWEEPAPCPSCRVGALLVPCTP